MGKPGRKPYNEDGWLGLLLEILRGTDDLSGAACAGHPELFDIEAQTPETYEIATEMCRTCPARSRCWAWAAKHDSGGVTAATTERPAVYRPSDASGDHHTRVPTDPAYRPRRNRTA